MYGQWVAQLPDRLDIFANEQAGIYTPTYLQNGFLLPLEYLVAKIFLDLRK
ncbi:MAG: hypothetical protein HKN87_09510 [Saprospiraceae bacterium]|nr:hypothetical protein [Saprospiraceae bacterium]